MKFKKFFPVLLSGIFVITLASCDFGSDEETVNQQEAQAGLIKVMAAINYAELNTPSSKSIVSKAPVTETYDFPGLNWSATGTYTYDDTNFFPYAIDITFTWNGFEYEDVTLVSGTTHYQVEVTDYSTYTYSYDGNFVFIYNGVTYTVTWDIDLAASSGTSTYSGTYTVNGETFTWNASY
jgi:hypothetical protein